MSAPTAPASGALGMYGLRLDGPPGLTDVPGALRPVAVNAPVLRLSVERAAPTLTANHSDEDSMAHRYPEDIGQVQMLRDPLSAHVTFRDAVDLRAVAHPAMARVAAVAAGWLGRDCLHAGAVVIDGGAWGVLGTKGAGKSSLLAQMHLLGLPVMADDALVLERGHVLAGPGSVDLRRPAAEHLGVGELLDLFGPVETTDTGPVRRERWRVALPPAPASAPLRGWVAPEWGDDDGQLHRVPAVTRVPALVSSMALRRPPADPEHFFDLALRPFVRWRRPRDFARSEVSARQLVDLLTAL